MLRFKNYDYETSYEIEANHQEENFEIEYRKIEELKNNNR